MNKLKMLLLAWERSNTWSNRATLIILIFLRNFRTTLIAVVSIPLSILLTLFYYINLTLRLTF